MFVLICDLKIGKEILKVVLNKWIDYMCI